MDVSSAMTGHHLGLESLCSILAVASCASTFTQETPWDFNTWDGLGQGNAAPMDTQKWARCFLDVWRVLARWCFLSGHFIIILVEHIYIHIHYIFYFVPEIFLPAMYPVVISDEWIYDMAMCAPKYVQETSVRIPGHTWRMKKRGYRCLPVHWCTENVGGFFVQDAGMLCVDSFSFMIGIDTMRWDAWPSSRVTWPWQLGTVNISLVSWMVGVGMPKGHVMYSFCERRSSQNDELYVKADIFFTSILLHESRIDSLVSFTCF